tara:strand:- start:45060 stop:45620 length:561 start_codon:yes stop_codon:yes gene_type:complete
MNWGFAPSKNASGWILHWSSTIWYSGMGKRDVYNYPGTSYSLEKPFKELLVEFLWDRLNYHIYEVGLLDDILANLEFDMGDYELNILGRDFFFPNDIEYWFPALINQDIPDNYNAFFEIIEPIVEDDDWLQEGVRKLIEQTVGEITNSEIVQRVENKELSPRIIYFTKDDYDEIIINAIHLQKLRS